MSNIVDMGSVEMVFVKKLDDEDGFEQISKILDKCKNKNNVINMLLEQREEIIKS